MLSVGVPIGLGVYLAWVNRDSATPTNTGFAAAAGGALIGAWLGFNVTSAGGVPRTAIAGATVGANLALIGLDILWGRSTQEPLPAPVAARPLVDRP